MRLIRYITFCLLFSGTVLVSCKKDPKAGEQIDMGYNYFPEDVGSYVIYEVDSTWRDDKSSVDTAFRYLLKEVIAATFIDNSGRPTLRIERFKKMYNDTIPYDSMNWVGPKVWYANKTSATAEKVEENIRYIKLVFPARKGKEWNGNIYNTLGSKNYEITSIDEAEIVNNISFDSVATVLQYDRSDFIQYIYEEEKFARNVGLIYKVRDSLYDGGTTSVVGYTYKQKVVSYGK